MDLWVVKWVLGVNKYGEDKMIDYLLFFYLLFICSLSGLLTEIDADLVDAAAVVAMESSKTFAWRNEVGLWVAAWTASLEELACRCSNNETIKQITTLWCQFRNELAWVQSDCGLLAIWVLDVLESSLVS